MGNLSPGQNFEQFKLIKQIGNGGMASVFKAYDNRRKKTVAIKVLRYQNSDIADELIRRFEREYQILKRLRSETTIRVYDYIDQEDTICYSMEYIAGGTLSEYLQRKVLPVPDAGRIVLQVARCLAEAHYLGFIHRDIKPSNIFIEGPNGIKVADFGVASMKDSKYTQMGVQLGTWSYMSPEQCQGFPVDQRSDIYALGIVFYKMITGINPFYREGTHSLTLQLQYTPDPPSFIPGINVIPVEIDQFIMKCLEKDPALRFASMVDLGFTLQSILEQHYGRRASQPPCNGEEQLTFPTHGVSPPSTASSTPCLVILYGPHQHMCYPLPLDINTRIGRSHEYADLAIPGDKEMSRSHALMSYQQKSFVVQDIGSVNGVYVNQRKLTQNETCILNPKDQLKIGQTYFLFDYLELSQMMASP